MRVSFSCAESKATRAINRGSITPEQNDLREHYLDRGMIETIRPSNAAVIVLEIMRNRKR